MYRQVKMLVMAGLAFSLAASSAGAGNIDLEISPREVRIGAFFSGSTVELTGSALPSLDVIIEVIGPQEKALFHLKGRVGPLWMNVEEVELKHAPHLYFLLTPKTMGSREGLAELELGLDHVEELMAVHPASLDKKEIFEQFLKLKRSQELYGEHYGVVGYDAPSGGRRGFHTEVSLPSSTAPGVYQIVATALDGDRVEDRTAQDLEVAEAGMIMAIHNLAVNHDLVYGIACVIVALIVGAIVGVVFKRAGAH